MAKKTKTKDPVAEAVAALKHAIAQPAPSTPLDWPTYRPSN